MNCFQNGCIILIHWWVYLFICQDKLRFSCPSGYFKIHFARIAWNSFNFFLPSVSSLSLVELTSDYMLSIQLWTSKLLLSSWFLFHCSRSLIISLFSYFTLSNPLGLSGFDFLGVKWLKRNRFPQPIVAGSHINILRK